MDTMKILYNSVGIIIYKERPSIQGSYINSVNNREGKQFPKSITLFAESF